jgi:hypothetical protein
VQQIKEALNPEYLEAITDDETGVIKGTIVDIMAHLFSTYGYINPTTLNDKRDEILALTVDNNRAIDAISNTIQNYAGVADAAKSEETPAQLINLTLILLTKSGLFATDIRKWYDHPIAEKTCPNSRHTSAMPNKPSETAPPLLTNSAPTMPIWLNRS